jgi:hypothetical protein
MEPGIADSLAERLTCRVDEIIGTRQSELGDIRSAKRRPAEAGLLVVRRLLRVRP